MISVCLFPAPNECVLLINLSLKRYAFNLTKFNLNKT